MINKKYIVLSASIVLAFFSLKSKQKEFVIITPTTKNLPSILQQEYPSFEIFYISKKLSW